MKLFRGSIFAFTIIATMSSAFGQSLWTNGSGDGLWADPNNWNPTGEPLGDAFIFNTQAVIALPNTATSTGVLYIEAASVTLNATTSTFGIDTLKVDDGSALALNIPATGNVSTDDSANSDFVGDGNGTGNMTLSGSGTLTISGRSAAVGIGGIGVMTQAGTTTVLVNTGLYIGSDGNVSEPPSLLTGTTTAAGGTGTYNITGGSSLNAQGIYVGVGSGTGGGTTTGGTTSTLGTLNINSSSTTALVATYLGIGTGTIEIASTRGIVNQISGGVEIDSLNVGVTGGTNSSGAYNLYGGTLFAGTATIGNNTGANGTFTQSGGSAEIENLVVGDAGNGIYTLAGGTLLVDTAFNIGAAGGTGTFTYQGGTLNLTSGIAIGALGTFNQDTSISLTDPGTQAVTVSAGGAYNLNTGTLTTGGNVFTGAGNFNFAGGTVAVTGSAWNDVLNGVVSGSSTINTTGGGANLSGNLTGNGTLNITGGGTVALSGVNNGAGTPDSWGATITGGSTLSAGSVTNLSSTGSYVIGTGSTFSLTNTTAQTFAGNISDTPDEAGPATFNTGTGKLTLTGDIDLSASSTTTIGAGGGLEVNTGTISNINGNAGNTADTFDVGDGTTRGTVYLLGTNTLPQATVNVGSTLYTENIAGNVTNHGVLGTLGTLDTPTTTTITGNLVSDGTLLIHSNGVAADEFGSLTTATLSGTIKVVGIGSITDAVIVDTTGGLTATIGTGAGDLTATGGSALFHFVLTENGTQLLLTTTQSALTGFAQTPNEVAVAGSLDHVINAGSPFPKAFLPLMGRFNELSASAIPQALEELTPESLQYSRDIAFENSTFLVQKMNGVDANLRGGYAGLDTSGISVTSPFFNSGLGQSLGSLLASDSPSFHQTAPNGVNYYPGAAGSPSSESITPSSTPGSPAAESAPEWNSSSQVISDSPNPYLAKQDPSSPQAPGFSEFISGDAILADLNQDHNAPNAPSSSANYTAVSATAGVSFRMTSHLAAGVLMDYSHTDATTDSSGSKTSVDSYSPGLYATYFDHGFYVNGLFSYGINSYSNSRDIGFLGETADSHPHGDQYVGDLDFGYDFHPDKNWVVGPTLGLTYTHLDIDSFSETGAPGADLNVDSQSADSLRSRLGGHVVFQTNTGDVLLQPNLTAMWQHEYLDNSSAITSSFGDFSSTPFVTDTAGPNRDSALIGVGLTATLNTSVALYLNYYADIGFEDYFAQSIVGGLKARF